MLSYKFAKDMHKEFEIWLLGELSLFSEWKIANQLQLIWKPIASWENMMIQSLLAIGNTGQWLVAYYMWQHPDQM